MSTQLWERGTASISDCGQYRYSLGRVWDTRKPLALFIGLNPSTADAESDDATLRRCISFATREDCGGLVLANLFAFRAKNPRRLREADDSIGPKNDAWISMLADRHRDDLTIACWGAGGHYLDRGEDVLRMLYAPKCFGRTADGYPKHPLYLPSNAPLEMLEVWSRRAEPDPPHAS